MVKLSVSLLISRTKTSDLNSVRQLNIVASNLEDVSLLRLLPNLEILSLSVNNISDLRTISQLLELKELYLRQNHIANFEDLEHLMKLAKLEVLSLEQNPISVLPYYRSKVLTMLPNLKVLDQVQVTPEQALMIGMDSQQDVPVPPTVVEKNVHSVEMAHTPLQSEVLQGEQADRVFKTVMGLMTLLTPSQAERVQREVHLLRAEREKNSK